MEGPVLILDDNPSWCQALERILTEENIFTITYVDPLCQVMVHLLGPMEVMIGEIKLIN